MSEIFLNFAVEESVYPKAARRAARNLDLKGAE